MDMMHLCCRLLHICLRSCSCSVFVCSVEFVEIAGIASYYTSKIDELSITLQDKQQDLRRLEAQRNDLNAQGFRFEKVALLIANIARAQ